MVENELFREVFQKEEVLYTLLIRLQFSFLIEKYFNLFVVDVTLNIIGSNEYSHHKYFQSLNFVSDPLEAGRQIWNPLHLLLKE